VSGPLHLVSGLSAALSPQNLMWVALGVLIGTVVGIMPGLGSPAAALAILLPLATRLNPTTGLIFMAGIYHGAKFAGSTGAILLNVPAEASSVVLCLDGHELAKSGRAGPALGMSVLSGFIASTFGVLALTVAAPAVASFAIDFGPPEFFALVLLGMLLVVSMTGKSRVKGFIAMTIGFLAATVGGDILSGQERYTFGNLNLYDGFEFLPIVLGLFAVAEVLVRVEETRERPVFPVPTKLRELLPSRADIVKCRRAIASGTVVGFFVGALPGAGSTIASFVSYIFAKNISKHPDEFGKGSLEGVAAPEAANNSEVGGAMIPLLSLGIAGSSSTAVMLAALLIFGVQPGPLLFTSHPGIVWPVIASLYLGNFMLVVLNLPLIPMWVQMLKIPYWLLYPIILCLAIVGAYSARQSMFDVGLMIVVGIIGYALRKLEIPPAPMLMAFVLGPQFELSLRQSLTISNNNPLIFVERPISAVILGLGAAVALAVSTVRRRSAKVRPPMSLPSSSLTPSAVTNRTESA
jgi:putative tricarboxylic transport membrane protein